MEKYRTLIIALAAIAVAVVVYLIVSKVAAPDAPDEQEEVSCSNRTVFRYKYPSKAYPVFANDYNAEVKLTSDVLSRIADSLGNLDLGVNVKNQVVELQEKLNQDNITFSTGLRNYFFSVNSDPCNDTLRMRYVAFVEEMSRRMVELRTVTAAVTTVPEQVADTEPAAPADTTAKLPKYQLKKDTAALTASLRKLDNVFEKNKRINNTIVNLRTVQPAQ